MLLAIVAHVPVVPARCLFLIYRDLKRNADAREYQLSRRPQAHPRAEPTRFGILPKQSVMYAP